MNLIGLIENSKIWNQLNLRDTLSILNNAPVCPKINIVLAFGSPSTYPYSAIYLHYMFILPYTIKFLKKNLSYKFIWPYRFIRFLTFSLPTLLFGLHVYLAHQSTPMIKVRNSSTYLGNCGKSYSKLGAQSINEIVGAQIRTYAAPLPIRYYIRFFNPNLKGWELNNP